MEQSVPPNDLQPLPIPEAAVPRRAGWWIHLTVLAAFPVFIGIMSLGRAPLAGPALTHTVRGLLATCGVQLGIFAVVLGIAWLASRATWEDLLLRWRGGFWPVPLGIAYSLLLRLALAILGIVVVAFLLITRIMKMEDLQTFSRVNRPDVGALVDIAALGHNPLYFWLTITLVSFVVAGLREELWRSAVLAGMRTLWPQRFGSRNGQILAVTLAAVVFGLGHVTQGPVAMVGAGLLGVGLGIIMVIHNSIWPAVVAHGMFDASTFAILPALARYFQ